MNVDIITREDLERFRIELLRDIKALIKVEPVAIPEVEEWLKSAEVKKILKISFSSLQNLRISGKISPKKILGVYYYKKSEIEALFK